MKSITQRILQARRKSKDVVDRPGIAPITFEGWSKEFDRASIEHDQCYLRVQAGVTDETIADCDSNFRKNLQFWAEGDWWKLLVTAVACGIVKIYSEGL